eukprot:GHUV01012873.1.p1 GENE.GHUV01012873.1~~GHUV01012873.1.p1  ORF type:complete len:244 (+),score=52.97 GHUV01012873.1:118-849(+)
MDICYIGVAGVIVCFAAAVWALKTPPQVPRQLSEWPSLGFLYLQLIRSALMRKRAPKDMKGKPIEVSLTVPARFDASRYAGFLKLVGCSGLPDQVPICYPFIESFRISMLAMSHRDFPFNVLGAVLARNTSTLYRKLAADEALTYSVSIDPNHVKNSKGDTEIAIVSTAADASGRTASLQQQLTASALSALLANLTGHHQLHGYHNSSDCGWLGHSQIVSYLLRHIVYCCVHNGRMHHSSDHS